ncbi:lipopolysaccharide biosynthesis protein [Vibrio alginolyticus]
MYRLKIVFKSDSFGYGVASIIQQIIPLAFLPLLMIFYSPKDFGVFASFTALSSMLVIFSTLRFEYCIHMSHSKDEQLSILYLGCFTSLLLVIFLVLSFPWVSKLSGWWKGYGIYVIIYTFFLAVGSAIYLYFNRIGLLNLIAKIKTVNVIIVAFLSLVMGFFNINDGLILSVLIASTINITWCLYEIKKTRKLISFDMMILASVAVKYFKQVKFILPSHLMNALYLNAPVLVISNIFGNEVSGIYSLSQKIVKAPVLFVGIAASEIFRSKVAKIIDHDGCINGIVQSIIKWASILSLIFGVMIFFLGKPVSHLLPSEWGDIYIYVIAMLPISMSQFIVNPIFPLYSILGRNDKEFNLNSFLFLTVIGWCLVNLMFKVDIINSLLLLSISTSIIYLIIILDINRMAKKYEDRKIYN